MILYHGTNADFAEIDLRKSKPNKDFGQGSERFGGCRSTTCRPQAGCRKHG